MEIFIDTANVDEIRDVNAWGIVDGVTTNPSLVSKTGSTLESVLKEICTIVDGPISAEVISVDAKSMVEEGKHLTAIHPDVVVKVPMIPEGLKATKTLNNRGIPVNVTLTPFTSFARPSSAHMLFSVIQQIMKHPLTEIGLERFLTDHHKATRR
ncbi:MAG: transaldolase family protein [Candidatus Binatia bacterium]